MSIVNVEQAEAWNGYEGGHWAGNHARYDAVNSGFNAPLLEAAAIGPADRVLDVGCGTGQVTRLAARTARHGHATGVDLSGPMLRRARALAAEEGVANATFEQGDAQVHPFPDGAYDVAVSRFAIMFFSDPVAAFANIRRALRPGGRVAFLSMRGVAEGDLGRVFAAIAPHVPALAAPREQGAAGPESLADPGRVRQVLTAAGFTEVTVTPVDAPQVWGADAEDAAAFLGAWGPIRHLLSRTSPGTDALVHEALVEAMRPFAEEGAVRLRGAAWLIRAARPGGLARG
ncbi:methyltransferase [Sphaerisporangium siamense]|uniref:Ubiquinone/menaquinone biosynthesis C-methylase UbiE n=1 Tax=Sphaerisporangium siamense TaxID=795645 RepID=A0A7W7GCU9_9ACTN|nr:class I SAM-dependent methyltransferase [Sphaerisporangium siamense]MBB4704260.1 ubiquinone/menaquinone biosynthesis C-methylase UbiE [Sphaerisporangium siamense]GII85058.1 methyltransferase [Sphaerisporangium siamense]